jgi:outer membrane lipoprotein SlyB
MKVVCILSALVILLHLPAFAQPKNNSITMKNGFFGWQFYQNDEKLKLGEVVKVMESNPQAYTYIKSARTNYTWANIVGSIGGFMLGYTLGTSAGGGNANWTVGGIGGGLVAVAIPLTIRANKQAKEAIVTYNEGSKSTSRKAQFNFGVTDNGVGLALRF